VAGSRITRSAFGAAHGTPVELFTLANRAGMTAAIATYGGIVVSLRVPDRRGRAGEVVLGHDRLEGYLRDNRPYLGAVVGRYANRIARGELPIDGQVHDALFRNDGEHHLHGGLRGFDKVVWSGTPRQGADRAGVALTYVSRDGEEGYPGNLAVSVTYELDDANELVMEATATTDRPTVCNIAHHGYFNLDWPAQRDVLGHVLQIEADFFTPVGEGLIPTGELRSVHGTPLDFRTPTPIGARIDADDPQLALAGGYDHNWVLNRSDGDLVPAARVWGPESGRVLEVLTTEPGLQFYSGNFLDGSVVGRGGEVYGRRAGLCLETQHFPDSPHHPGFPSTVLRPGETYRSRTVYRFSVRG
jgi:aldose 1-epimerase